MSKGLSEQKITDIFEDVQYRTRGTAQVISMEREHPGILNIKIECRMDERESGDPLHMLISNMAKDTALQHQVKVDIDKSVNITHVKINLKFSQG